LRRDKERDFDLVGRVIADKYKVLDVLGQGGFGTVYLVEIVAGMVGEKLALKLLPEELSHLPKVRDQFLNEIRVAMKMVDRYIVQIRDVGTTEDGLLYYTMDYCRGQTLREVLEAEGRIAVPRLLLIARRVLRALQTAHKLGIIHRDLKPANIMVESEGGRETVRVLDFGIATAITGSGQSGEQGFAGSPYYMPPEQFMNQDLGFYTDTYALGVILYECVTGVKPYGGSTPQEVFQNLKRGQFPPPEALAPEVESYPGLSALILKSLQRNPERRFQSARELFDAVNTVLAGRGGADPEAEAPPGWMAPAASPGGAPAAAAAPAARRAAARIRQRRAAAHGSQPSHAGAVLVGSVLVAMVFLGVVFQKRIRTWFKEEPRATVVDEGRADAEPPRRQDGPRGEDPSRGKDDAGAAAARKDDTENASSLAAERARAEAQREAWIAETVAALAKGGEAEKWDEVAERASALLAQDPTNATAVRWLGLAAYHLGDFPRAEEMLGKAHGLIAELPAADLRALARARVKLAPPRLDAAENAAELALKRGVRDPESILLLAEILEASGQKAKLRKLLVAARKGQVASAELEALHQRVVVDEPRRDREEAERLLAEARVALGAGKYQSAVDLAQQSADRVSSVDTDLVAIEAHLGLGKAAEGLKLLEELEEDLRESGGSTPETDPSLRARVHLLRGRFQLLRRERGDADALREAQIAFEQALALAGEIDRKEARELAAETRMWRAKVHAWRGDAELALEDMKAARDTDNPALVAEQAWTSLLAAQEAKGKESSVLAYDAAAGRLNKLLKMDGVPEDLKVKANFELGLSYYHLGRLKESNRYYPLAANRFLEAERLGLDSVELHESWARTYEQMGKLKEAAERSLKVYELKPAAASCLRAAEYYLRANPRSKEGLDLLRAGLERFPKDEALKARYLEASQGAKG
jgi:tetratricopeptide (TPR) repeat protein